MGTLLDAEVLLPAALFGQTAELRGGGHTRLFRAAIWHLRCCPSCRSGQWDEWRPRCKGEDPLIFNMLTNPAHG